MRLPDKASMDFEKKLGLVFPDSEPPVIRIPEGSVLFERTRISVCEPSIGEVEKQYIQRVIDSGWVSSLGPEVRGFEKEFATKVGVNYAISCTSGTAALHLALATLGVGKGDEVIIPTFTMIATINAIIYCGATPILVDADEHLNMDINQLEKKITNRTKAILPVHIYGYPCNMGKILEITNKYKLWVVEDAAESHGSYYKGKMTGSIGDIGIYSFYANKIITTGEGGILTTNSQELAERIRTLMNHAFSPERHFCHRLLGFNYRMTALQAALGRAQLTRWDEILEKKSLMRNRYIQNLNENEHIVIPNLDSEEGIVPVCWMFGVILNPRDGKKKNEIRRILAERGIETRNFFVPMHLQPIHYKRFEGERYPKSEELMETGFYLPSAIDLSTVEIDYVCENLIDVVEIVYKGT